MMNKYHCQVILDRYPFLVDYNLKIQPPRTTAVMNNCPAITCGNSYENPRSPNLAVRWQSSRTLICPMAFAYIDVCMLINEVHKHRISMHDQQHCCIIIHSTHLLKCLTSAFSISYTGGFELNPTKSTRFLCQHLQVQISNVQTKI